MSKITNTFVKLNQKQLEQKYQFIQNYIGAQNAAEGSNVDANSNVASKNVATMAAEINKDINIQIKRYWVSKEIEKMFGKELAEEYNRQIEAHEIYVHDESALMPYCVSITMYPFLLNGLKGIGSDSVAPKHLLSFCGGFINLVYAISSQFAGAVATVEFLLCFDYFARKEYGDNYLETHRKEIANAFQYVLYQINMPAAARGYQSIFWNISLFDRNYLEHLFGEFVFPDFTKPDFDSVTKLQEFFINWQNEERRRALLTFPVVTASMLVDENGPKDEKFLDVISDVASRGASFFNYESETVDSLASCCFAGDQKVLVRDFNGNNLGVRYQRFDELGITNDGPNRKNFLVMHNGNWVKGKLITLPSRKMYKVTTSNGKVITVSDNHLNPCLRGDVRTDELMEDDYLMFNTRELSPCPEQDKHLTFEQGYAVGAFLGDGSFGSRTKYGIYEINYSLNKTTKLQRSVENFKKVLHQFDSEANVNVSITDEEMVPVRMSCKQLVEFIQYWTNWEEGTKAPTKKLNLDCLLQSVEFRKGILVGWYDTDGGNSNRCYTTSKELAEDMEILLTSLGKHSSINVSDKTGLVAFDEDGKQYTRKYPLYCVRWYEPKNKRKMHDVYVVKNNSVFFKIKSIEEVHYEGDIYCFEMENKEESYFTLPNGIITHNCRLRNELQENTFSYSLGAGGTQSGSLNVITININRLVQDAVKNNKDILDTLKEQVEKVHKYQAATKEVFKAFLNANMLDAYREGYIDMNKQFMTIGINGVLEAAEFMGYTPNNNEEYKKWTASVLKVIYDSNKEEKQKYGIMFNTEFVPAENLAVKNYNWDKSDGYKVPETRNCYNSYLYRVEDNEIDPIDKFFLHGKENLQYLDGGSALHLNLADYPTKETYKKLYKIAAKTGCNYWTWNVLVTVCQEKDCGYIDKRTLDRCSKCGSTNVAYGTRVLGYLRLTKNFSKERQIEASRRVRHKMEE